MPRIVPRIIECVANFSEGRDAAKVDQIVGAIEHVAGVSILDRTMDTDHHRSVITFAGDPEAVLAAAVEAVGRAAEIIDLTHHQGVHPRVGATDVLPFVPVEDVTLEECAALAHRAGEQIWVRFGIPVYFYEAAARSPHRVRLEDVRRGGFERLRDELPANAARHPDLGNGILHPTAGAVIVGARPFLIAFNVILATENLKVALEVAKAIRYSSGGFRFVKALGLPLSSRGQVQVSINITDFVRNPIPRVFEAVRTEAARFGVSIAGSEIIGLVPQAAWDAVGQYYLRCENFETKPILESRLRSVR